MAQTLYQSSHNDLEGFFECDICQFIGEKEEYLAECAVVLTSPLLHRNHEISCKYDCYMSSQGIKGPAVAFADHLKIAFAGLEKDLYLPPFP